MKENITEQLFNDDEKNIFIKMFFKNGAPHGESVTYKKDGEVIQKINFVDGKMNGEFVLYDQKKMKAKMNYKNDKLNGKAEYFDEKEKVIGIENYKDGKKDGLAEWKDNDGNILFRENYRDGLLNEDKTEYYPSGQVKKISHYVNGEIIGQPDEYDENGNIKVNGEKKKNFSGKIIQAAAAVMKLLTAKLGFE